MTTVTPARRRDRQDAAALALGVATQRWTALGTSAQIVVTDPAALPEARSVMDEVLAEIDVAASRFRADSELSRLNAASGEWMRVSPVFRHALRVALDAAAATDGLVDPTVGASLVSLGYDRTFRLVQRDAPDREVVVVAATGWRHVDLDEQLSRARVPAGTLLDLGATAKALAADLAAHRAGRTTGCGVLVNLGGDISVDGAAPAGGWPVSICDVADPDLPDDGRGQTVAISTGGLATSSTAARRWSRGGSVVHHLIDPLSGRPAAAPWRTVSVVADTCTLANTASTAAVIVGRGAAGWLSSRGFHARLVGVDGQVVTVGEWPREDRS